MQANALQPAVLLRPPHQLLCTVPVEQRPFTSMMQRSQRRDSSSLSTPCCDCFSLPNQSGYLSCIDISTGAVLDSCCCNGRCPPQHCALKHCVTSHLGTDQPRRARAARTAPAAAASLSFSSSSSSPSASDVSSPSSPLPSDAAEPHAELSGSSSLHDVLQAGLSYDAFVQHTFHFWPGWQPIWQQLMRTCCNEVVVEAEPFDFSASYQLALERHRNRDADRRRRQPDSSSDTEQRRQKRRFVSGQDEQKLQQTAETDADTAAPSASSASSSSASSSTSPASSSSSSSSSSAALIFTNDLTGEAEGQQEWRHQQLQSDLSGPVPVSEEDSSLGDAPLLPPLSDDAAAEATLLAEGELCALPDALRPLLTSSLFSRLLRRGTRSDGWGCFASLLGVLIGSSVAVQEKDSQCFARDLNWRLRRWNASTLYEILEPVPPELRDPALSHLPLVKAAQLPQPQLQQVHVELQQYVQRYLAGRIMSSGLEMLRLCQNACLSTSDLTVYCMQLQPCAVIIKLPPFVPPAFSSKEPRAVFLLQPGFLSQNFQIVLEQAATEAAGSEAAVVFFALDHPLVLAAERWLREQQAHAHWQRRSQAKRPPNEREEKKQPSEQQPRQPDSLLCSPLRGGLSEEKEASWHEEDAQLPSSPQSGHEEKYPYEEIGRRQQPAERAARGGGVAASRPSERPLPLSASRQPLSRSPRAPRAPLAAPPPASPSLAAAGMETESAPSSPSPSRCSEEEKKDEAASSPPPQVEDDSYATFHTPLFSERDTTFPYWTAEGDAQFNTELQQHWRWPSLPADQPSARQLREMFDRSRVVSNTLETYLLFLSWASHIHDTKDDDRRLAQAAALQDFSRGVEPGALSVVGHRVLVAAHIWQHKAVLQWWKARRRSVSIKKIAYCAVSVITDKFLIGRLLRLLMLDERSKYSASKKVQQLAKDVLGEDGIAAWDIRRKQLSFCVFHCDDWAAATAGQAKERQWIPAATLRQHSRWTDICDQKEQNIRALSIDSIGVVARRRGGVDCFKVRFDNDESLWLSRASIRALGIKQWTRKLDGVARS